MLCFEGFPMVVREAFALGAPVAASRTGALPEIVPIAPWAKPVKNLHLP